MFAPLVPVVAQMVIEGITKGSRPILPHLNITGLILSGLAVLTIILAGVFALMSLFIYLQAYVDAVNAALMIAAGLAVVSGLLALAGKGSIKRYGYVTYHRAASRSSPVSDLAQTVKDLIDGVTTELEEPIRENPKTAIALASLAGYLAGDFHKRR